MIDTHYGMPSDLKMTANCMMVEHKKIYNSYVDTVYIYIDVKSLMVECRNDLTLKVLDRSSWRSLHVYP